MLVSLESSLKPDILLLQETREPRIGGSVLWQCVSHHDRGSAIVCRDGHILPVPLPNYEGWVVGGELMAGGLSTSGRPLFVFSVHAPSSNPAVKRQNYVTEVGLILDQIKEGLPSDADLIVGGDFNFLSLGKRLETEELVTSAAEMRVIDKFSSLGLVSCWSQSHQGKALAQTLRWSNNPSTPYHCDGIFVPEDWKENIICEVLTSSCFELSDHYPVMAWIDSESQNVS